MLLCNGNGKIEPLDSNEQFFRKNGSWYVSLKKGKLKKGGVEGGLGGILLISFVIPKEIRLKF